MNNKNNDIKEQIKKYQDKARMQYYLVNGR